MKYYYIYNFEFGKLAIQSDDEYITDIFFENSFHKISSVMKEVPLIKYTYNQLLEYFIKKRRHFDVPYKLQGSKFQNLVWNELLKIPYGQTVSYKHIAIQLNNEKAYRAVGMANNKNRLPIIIPCHRVIGSNDSLTGFSGGLNIKEYLLNLEREVNL